MALVNIITKLFGNKYEKDVKNIMPIVEKINQEYTELNSITNDELRKKTQDLLLIILTICPPKILFATHEK